MEEQKNIQENKEHDSKQAEQNSQTTAHHATFSHDERYAQLKQRNRQRLIGAGALVLVISGLFAMLSNQNSQSQHTSKEITPNIAQTASSTDAHTPNDVSPESETSFQAASTTSTIEMAPAIVQESHNQLTTQRTVEQQETEQLAPNTANPAELTRQVQENQTIQRAKQAQLAAEQTRQQERRHLAQSQENPTHSHAGTQQSKADNAKSVAQQPTQANAQAPNHQSNTHTRSQSHTTANYIVQAGAFSQKVQAEKVRAKVQSLGYSAHITEAKTAKGRFYRVQATGFNSRKEAQNAAVKMKNNGLDSLVMKK